MKNEQSEKFVEKIDTICKRIETYTEKEFSIKSKVKSYSYIEKLNALVNKIDEAKKTAPKVQKEDVIDDNKESENVKQSTEYNPYADNFRYKDKLDKHSGDIDKVIDELKSEDKLGYRNAYIINEIETHVNAKKEEEKRVEEERIAEEQSKIEEEKRIEEEKIAEEQKKVEQEKKNEEQPKQDVIIEEEKNEKDKKTKKEEKKEKNFGFTVEDISSFKKSLNNNKEETEIENNVESNEDIIEDEDIKEIDIENVPVPTSNNVDFWNKIKETFKSGTEKIKQFVDNMKNKIEEKKKEKALEESKIMENEKISSNDEQQ